MNSTPITRMLLIMLCFFNISAHMRPITQLDLQLSIEDNTYSDLISAEMGSTIDFTDPETGVLFEARILHYDAEKAQIHILLGNIDRQEWFNELVIVNRNEMIELCDLGDPHNIIIRMIWYGDVFAVSFPRSNGINQI